MNLVKYTFRLFCLLILVLSSCSKRQSFDGKKLRDQVWIYDSDSLADSIGNFTDNYIVFDVSNVSLNGEIIGEYELLSDTLKIYQISSMSIKNINGKEDLITQFEGIITKLDVNEILIKKLSGYFPIQYMNNNGDFGNSTIIKLTNQKRKKRNNGKFNYISIVSSSCYGNCPAFHVELDQDRNLKFNCTSDCKRIGNFQGKISRQDMNKIEDHISYLNLHNDTTEFTTPIDAPETVLKISVNGKEYYFEGYQMRFQFKMQQMINELYIIAEKSDLVSTKEKIKFRANLRIVPFEKTITFLPPQAD